MLGLHLHRIKRFIGRTTQGFEFLGDQIREGARLRTPPRGCVACAFVLASCMSERATGNAFFRSSCIGSLAASTEWSAGEEASNAHGITSVRLSQRSIRRDESPVRGRHCAPA
jgi:hypothetical protein